MNEKTYIEMLNDLYESINSDNIPEKDKAKAITMLKSLHGILWQYSA